MPEIAGSPSSSLGAPEAEDLSASGMAVASPPREADPQPDPSPPDPSSSAPATAPQESVNPPEEEESLPPENTSLPEEPEHSSPEAEDSLSPRAPEDSPLEEAGQPPQEDPRAEEVPPPRENDPPAAEEDDPGPSLPAPGTTFQDCTPSEACALPMMVVLPPAEGAGAVPSGPLAVSVHEVTVEQWRACARDANGCDPRVLDREGNLHPDGTEFPVVAVTWDDAQAYVAWLGRTTGQPYRLLNEGEWEYMARAGTRTGRYWNSDSELCRFANAWDLTAHNSIDNSTRAFADCEDSYANTAPVGSFAANGFGVHDALGNVEEWVQNRVVRGGSWRDGPEQLDARRRSELRTVRSSYVGFRVARTLN